MPPENQGNPELETLLVQQENHNQEVMGALDTLIQQNDKNNPEPILEAQLEVQDKIKESAEKQAELLKEIRDFNEQEKTIILRGHKGERGERGDKGDQGEKGDKGDKGDVGDRGEKGDIGETGPQGVQGDQGEQGEPGQKGDKGDDGKAGVDGLNGKDGTEVLGEDIVKKLSELPPRDRLPYSVLKDAPEFIRQVASRDYTFLELTDVPKSYASQGGKFVQVKSDASGLEFGSLGPSGTLGTFTNLYVNATTGSNSNDGLTASTPFLTIQKALNTLAVRLFSGNVIVNIADGTYNEQLVPQEMLGATTSSGSISSRVFLLGDTATPGNVRIIGSGGRTIWFNYLNTVYSLLGLTIEGNGSGRGIQIVSSRVFASSMDIKNAATPLQISNFGYLEWGTSSTGGNVECISGGITILDNGYFSCTKKLVLTGLTGTGISVSGKSVFSMTGGADIFAAGGGMNLGINATNNSTVNIQGAWRIRGATSGSAAAFTISSNSICNITAASATVEIDNCTHSIVIDQKATFIDPTTGGNGITYINGSPAVVELDPDSAAISTGSFLGGASVTYTNINSNALKLGQDDRFPRMPGGGHGGTLPLGVTVFFNAETTQANYMPLYIADANESIDKFLMVSGTANGAAHTDTYTLYKNGVATAMTFNVTNAASGSTTSNPITLVSGDHIGFAVATDAATAAADVRVQVKIRKR